MNTQIQTALDTITEKVEALRQSAEWQAHLRMQALIPQYSFNNLLLIRDQRPDATNVMGYRAWKRLGRQVKAGEGGIRIIAPITKRRETKTDADEDQELLLFFSAVSVFDISQTEGKALPDPTRQLEDDDPRFEELIRGIEDAITNRGFTVIHRKLAGGVNGVVGNGEVLIQDGLARSHQFKTLVHEYAHILLHVEDDIIDRSTKEVEAEATAFVVADHFGLDTAMYSAGYLAGWSDDLDQLRRSGTRIQQSAKAIIMTLEVPTT